MAIDYAALADTAEELVQEAGRAITAVRFNVTPQDAAKPWLGAANPRSSPAASVSLFGAFVEPSSAVKLGISTQDSELVKRSTKIIIIAPGAGFAHDLRTFHEITDEGETWKIVAVETLKPGDTTLLYFIGIAR